MSQHALSVQSEWRQLHTFGCSGATILIRNAAAQLCGEMVEAGSVVQLLLKQSAVDVAQATHAAGCGRWTSPQKGTSNWRRPARPPDSQRCLKKLDGGAFCCGSAARPGTLGNRDAFPPSAGPCADTERVTTLRSSVALRNAF